MVGIENTFKVTEQGGVCITGDNPGLIPVFRYKASGGQK